MSNLDELIKEYCTNGVEYKEIQSFAQLLKGMSGVSNKWAESGNCRFIEYKNAYDNLKIDITRLPYATVKNLENQLILKRGDILFTSASETPDECAISSVIEAKIEDGIFLDDHLFGIRIEDTSKFDPVYLNYYFRTESFRSLVNKTVRGVTRYYISIPSFMQIKIPVPPLPVQREIVRILDNFTELTARKKQYEYYRDELLKPKADIPMVALKDIATDIYRGSGITRDQVTEDGMPCVRYGEIYTTYNTWFDECVSHTNLDLISSPKYFEHGDILFAITGESVEDIAKSVAYVGHEKCLAGGDIVVMKHKQNPRYLAHVLSTQSALEQKSKGKVKSKVVHSNVPSIEQITIPLPPLDVQERYANVLDNFETLCNNLNIGLPAEIEARQKQYEYYRDLLLSCAEDRSQFVNVERERECRSRANK